MRDKIRKAWAHPKKIPRSIQNEFKMASFGFRKLFIPGERVLSIDGYDCSFACDSYPDEQFIRSFSEQAVISDMLSRLTTEDVVWDVGANLGVYTCFAGSVSPRVVAFEPDGPTRDSLQTNIELNDVDATVSSYGLGDTTRTIERELNLQRENEPTAVETRTGDELVEQAGYPKPSVIKIDIEGMELAALHGLTEVISDVTLVYVELHSEYLAEHSQSPEIVKQWLSERQFEVTEVSYGDGNPIVRGEK